MNQYLSVIMALFFTSLLFTSCSDSSKDTSNVVDLDEFLPKSEKSYNYDEDTTQQIKEHIPDSLELLIKSKISDAVFLRGEDLSNTKYFPDRLDFTQRFQHEIKIDSASYDIVIWEFEDSIHTINAFYNWMDCFGDKCKSIRIGESKWIYDGSFQIFIDDLSIIYVASDQNINVDLWLALFQPKVKEKWNYRLHQALKRKTKWYGPELE